MDKTHRLESLLAEAYPIAQRLIRTNLPDTVEVSVTEQPERGRRTIHLINKTTSGHYMGRETNHLIHQTVPVSDVDAMMARLVDSLGLSDRKPS